MERRKASGIRENRWGVSGALARSGRKKFLTANILPLQLLLFCLGGFSWPSFFLLLLSARVGNEKCFCVFAIFTPL